MKSSQGFLIVFVTAPNLAVARKLSRAALKKRLIACANLIPGLESHYWWRGKLEKANEVLVMMKTSKRRVAALEKLIVAEHPYDTPEFVVLSPAGIARKYRQWWSDCLK